MKHCVVVFAGLALSASPAPAAGTLVLHLIPRADSIPRGGTMVIDVVADYSGVPSGQAISGWKFDVLGDPNGTLAGDVNDVDFPNGVANGAPSGSDLLDYAGGQLPLGLGGGRTTGDLGTLSFTDSGTSIGGYVVNLDVTNYWAPAGALNLYVNASGSQSRAVEVCGIAGCGHLMSVIAVPFSVVPGPGAAWLLAPTLVAGIRRRR